MSAVWFAEAQRIFAADSSVASVSVVSRALLSALAPAWQGASIVQAATAAWPECFVNPSVADLVGASQGERTRGVLEEIVAAATLRGLYHVWIVVDDGGAVNVVDLLSPPPADLMVLGELAIDDPVRLRRPLHIGVDAAWLTGGESGAQVFVFELLKAMSLSDAIGSIVLLSNAGGMPGALTATPKVVSRTWAEMIGSGNRLDVVHRPYQPGVDTDFARYRQVAPVVALTVLDFIAYDNPAYHESAYAFRQYQRSFDQQIVDADQLFTISEHVRSRLERQFAHRLTSRVRAIHLGADHLDAAAARIASDTPPALTALRSKQFLAVLGNDFAHKNRDFAVRVFSELCRRGYTGQLLLAGYHLDAGSSFEYEMAGADAVADRVVRVGSLSAEDKVWVLHHAAAVLYPTSSEGFGLIPFEAAALGTPTAFVRFGPLAETLADVPAVSGWRVNDFADHVASLVDNPAPFLDAVMAARRALTWQRCAAATIGAYRDMLNGATAWHERMAVSHGPGKWQRATEVMSEYSRRAARRLSRLSIPGPGKQ